MATSEFLSPIPAGTSFYNLNIGETDDSPLFDGVNTLKFDATDFYVTQQDTDTAIINFRGISSLTNPLTATLLTRTDAGNPSPLSVAKSDDTDTGISIDDGTIRFITSNSNRFAVNDTSVTALSQLNSNTRGSKASPSFQVGTVDGGSAPGLWRDPAGSLGVSVDGEESAIFYVGKTSFADNVQVGGSLNVNNQIVGEAFYVQNGNVANNLVVKGLTQTKESTGPIDVSVGCASTIGFACRDAINTVNFIANGSSQGFFSTSGVLTFTIFSVNGDGTAAAPTIRRATDTDTGVFFPSGDQLGFTAGGADLLRIVENGASGDHISLGVASETNNRVGINLAAHTTRPSATLHVGGNAKIEDKVVADGFYLNTGGEVPRKAVQSFASAAEWTFTHNLNTNEIQWSIYNDHGISIVPARVATNDKNITSFYLSEAKAGRAVVIG